LPPVFNNLCVLRQTPKSIGRASFEGRFAATSG
jgi:hypothetical protein